MFLKEYKVLLKLTKLFSNKQLDFPILVLLCPNPCQLKCSPINQMHFFSIHYKSSIPIIYP